MLLAQLIEPQGPQVSLRRLDVSMAQHLLQDVDIHAVCFAERRSGVTENMGPAAFVSYAGQFRYPEDGALH